MAKEDINELWRQHRLGQDKYTYFLLAVSASAIAFAIQKTEGRAPALDLCVVGAAALCWGLSFYFGCKNLVWVQTALYTNFSLLQLQNGTHPKQPDSVDELFIAIEATRSATNSHVEKVRGYAIWQFRFLILGALLFIAWHVWSIYLNGKP